MLFGIDSFNNFQTITASAEKKLKEASIENAKIEIEWFLQKTLNFSLIEIKLDSNLKFTNEQINCFNDFIDRRISGEPFQYILKESSFYGYDFIVNKHTLIPRPESEIIISIAKKNGHYYNALDIGTGSAALAITLSLEKIASNIDAIDISEEALKTAKKNTEKYNIQNVKLIKRDIFKSNFQKKYDLIVCNPPYISKQEYLNLDKHIKCYEPKIALTDNGDGLSFYKFFSKKLMDFLSPKGRIILEIGQNKTKPIIENLFQKNHINFNWHKDLNGDYRIIELYQ
jgi:release factor glutamine methyltransferase